MDTSTIEDLLRQIVQELSDLNGKVGSIQDNVEKMEKEFRWWQVDTTAQTLLKAVWALDK